MYFSLYELTLPLSVICNTACYFTLSVMAERIARVVLGRYFVHLSLIDPLLSRVLLNPFSIPFSRLGANVKQVLLFLKHNCTK